MKQAFLFGDTHMGNSAPVAVAGSAPTLTRAQKRFNKLTGQIQKQRETLKAWQDYVQQYRERLERQLLPLEARLRDRGIEMVRLLDHNLGAMKLTRRQSEHARALLLDLLDDLRDGDDDNAQLNELYRRHGGEDDEPDEDEDELAMMESIASGLFGVKLDPDHGAKTQAQLAAHFSEKLAEKAQDSVRQKTPREPSAKSQRARAAKQERQEQRQRDASQALREIYRKLASQLHPDREIDPDEQARKTTLMKQANQAYEARDLLALLELQLRIEQINPAQLGEIAEEKLEHFNHVLEQQVRSLQEEISEMAAPVVSCFFEVPPRDIAPWHIDRELDRETAALRTSLARLERDLVRFTDAKEFKRAIVAYESSQDDESDALDELLEMLMRAAPTRAARPTRGPRRKR